MTWHLSRTLIPRCDVEPQSEIWEAAYRRFETQDEEIAKFVRRLRLLGADAWPRSARVVELFCGRGNGMLALSQLGFTDLAGIDTSPTLTALYRGPGEAVVGDCRALPWPDASKDILIAQGGLHHLPELPGDLDRVLAEARRVLRPGGRLVVVEPWLTPFLQFVHFTSFSWFRRFSKRLDAFATMTEHEYHTYENWLLSPALVSSLFDHHFRAEHRSTSFGKLRFVGIVKP